MARRDQSALGNQYALKALKEQRATFAGEIELCKRKLRWAQKQIRHIDATLHLLEPSLNVATIPPKRPQKRIKLFRQGELGRHIIDALRRAGKPLAVADVVTGVIEQGGLGEGARPTLYARIRGNLAYLERAGKAAKLGAGRAAKWQLADG